MSASMESYTAVLPEVKGGVVPYLQVDGAMSAADFYRRAFGAETVFTMPVDDRGHTLHVHLHINGSSVMLSDGCGERAPEKPQGYSLLLTVGDIDAWWQRAVAAGAEVVMPVTEMFWGDRYGQLRDPFDVLWAMDQPKR